MHVGKYTIPIERLGLNTPCSAQPKHLSKRHLLTISAGPHSRGAAFPCFMLLLFGSVGQAAAVEKRGSRLVIFKTYMCPKLPMLGMVTSPLIGILIMGLSKPLRNWVDEFIPYYMEIMGV